MLNDFPSIHSVFIALIKLCKLKWRHFRSIDNVSCIYFDDCCWLYMEYNPAMDGRKDKCLFRQLSVAIRFLPAGFAALVGRLCGT